MSLSNEERKAIVDYRIEKADIAFDEALKVSSLGLWNLAANRLYYALYYAASALLLFERHSCKSHAGLLTLMHMHYVKTGRITPSEGALIRTMFNKRHEGDYEDFIEVSQKDIEELTPQVLALKEKLKSEVVWNT